MICQLAKVCFGIYVSETLAKFHLKTTAKEPNAELRFSMLTSATVTELQITTMIDAAHVLEPLERLSSGGVRSSYARNSS
jgi:hypothetical protein